MIRIARKYHSNYKSEQTKITKKIPYFSSVLQKEQGIDDDDDAVEILQRSFEHSDGFQSFETVYIFFERNSGYFSAGIFLRTKNKGSEYSTAAIPNNQGYPHLLTATAPNKGMIMAIMPGATMYKDESVALVFLLEWRKNK